VHGVVDGDCDVVVVVDGTADDEWEESAIFGNKFYQRDARIWQI
jgi:hypothetical protein